ncbi:MAG: glycosyltransferase [Paramuribaculum sp.]|nr:glycosyltransferase [Paramuribaculum sp.]
MKILIPNHDLDSVTRHTMACVGSGDEISIVIAGPGEKDRGGIEAPPVRSKLDFKAITAYRRILTSGKFDLTFSPSTSGLSTMLFASLGTGVVNIGYRGTQAKVRRSDPTNWLALLNPRMAHCVCETEDIRLYMAGLIGEKKVSGMPKPYELEWVEKSLSEPKVAEGRRSEAFGLIYIGMSAGRPHKGLRQLVDAMKLTGNRDIQLTVIGSFDESTRLAAPEGKVIFCGPRPSAVDYIPGHDLYVLPSLRDASPRVVREAQACGVPCIVSDIPGARDLIIPGTTGLLVRPGSPEAIAEAICRLYDNRTELKAMAAATRPYIAANYAMAPYAAYFRNLFLSLSR